jgi:hypothetical protein
MEGAVSSTSPVSTAPQLGQVGGVGSGTVAAQ